MLKDITPCCFSSDVSFIKKESGHMRGYASYCLLWARLDRLDGIDWLRCRDMVPLNIKICVVLYYRAARETR